MSRKWVVFASLMLAASMPSFANSSASDPQVLLASPSSGEVAVGGSAANFENRFPVRDILRDAGSGNNGILAASWMNSPPSEIKNQERTATLPEPGSGVLLGIGLLAVFWQVGTRLRAYEH